MSKDAAQPSSPAKAENRRTRWVKSRWSGRGSVLGALVFGIVSLQLYLASSLVDYEFYSSTTEPSLKSIILSRTAAVSAVLAAGFFVDATRRRLLLLQRLTRRLPRSLPGRLILVGTAIALVVPVQRLGDTYLEKREVDRVHQLALDATSDRVDVLELFLQSLAPSNYQIEGRDVGRSLAEDGGSVGVGYRRDGGRNPEAEIPELHAMLLGEGALLGGVWCNEVKTYSPDRVVGRYLSIAYYLAGYRIGLRVDHEDVVVSGRLDMSGPITPIARTDDDREDLLDEMADCLDFLLEN